MSFQSIDKRFILAIGTLGFTAIITQTILLREFLSVFAGNELVIGIVLANWMILTGVGSFLGKFAGHWSRRMIVLIVLLFLIAVLPITTVFLLYYLRNLFFPVGTMIGIMESLYSSFLLMMPYCLTAGFLFTLVAQLVSEWSRSNLISAVYLLEAAGSILGGLLFNLVMIFFLNTFQALFLLTFINLGICLFLSLKYGRPALNYALLIVAGAFLVLAVFVEVDKMAKQFLYRDQELLFYRDTPYGNLAVTRQGDQKNFYENNALLFSTQDVVTNEETVHFAMVQHPQPQKVLLISGGISGTTQEILKYNIRGVDYVEINPWLIGIGQKYTSALTDPRIRVITQDARRYVRNTSEQYDVVLINLPDPSTAQINRYYTVEFLKELKRKLKNGAIVSLSLLPSTDYMSAKAREISSIMHHTLLASFQHVLIIPGMRNYYLASDSGLSINITQKIRQRGIATNYVNEYYLDDRLLQQRSDELMKNLDRSTVINRDFTPIAYYRQLLYWLSYFNVNLWIPAVLLMLILVFVAAKLNPISFGLFTGGFAASSIEFLLLVSFQILHGYIYQATGAIITVFMAGLAAGAAYERRKSEKSNVQSFVGVQCAIGIYALLLPLVLALLRDAVPGNFIMHAVFFLLTFVIAVFIGAEFSMATKLQKGSIESVAGELYSIDLIGSALGALMVATYLLPLLGIAKASLIVAALSFASALITMVNRNKFTSTPTSGWSYV
ncbi:MAG: fused MFS/spermidine synthase [candidate division KSB1 bacterium]|nr:fused MFS/spermidine synthase [candidate division KSB1 bacterium]MDZ7303106.1 fused MFS/spermidine synthase [candidate division KSB1 bacterium]MDZ7312645.1 fused MFS/spermidine synthase [candidate division KSB1 bacterium]